MRLDHQVMLPPLLDQLVRGLTPARPTEAVPLAPDGFLLDPVSDFREEHRRVSVALQAAREARGKKSVPALPLKARDRKQRTRLYLALLERVVAHELGLIDKSAATIKLNEKTAYATLTGLLTAGVDDEAITPTLAWGASLATMYHSLSLLTAAVASLDEKAIKRHIRELGWLWSRTRNQRARFFEGEQNELRRFFHAHFPSDLFELLSPGDYFADVALAELRKLPKKHQEPWIRLLAHCQKAIDASPSEKWLTTAERLLQSIEREDAVNRIERWLALSNQPKSHPCLGHHLDSDERQKLYPSNADTLRGLAWLIPLLGEPRLTRALTQLALDSFRKIRGAGPRAVKLGNAAVHTLGRIGNTVAVGQLGVLKARVKFGTAQSGIQKVLTRIAKDLKLTLGELEELAVPSYGLDQSGRLTRPIGELTAVVQVTATGVSLVFLRGARALKAAPSSLGQTHPEELADLRDTCKALGQLHRAQVARIEEFYLAPRTWKFAAWKERYLDHPLVGRLAEALLWSFRAGKNVFTALWDGRQFVDAKGKPVRPAAGAEVELWHPLGEKQPEVATWRRVLLERELTQPFKQAHREVYVLTEAERRTGTYSNRFAGHILRQHQLNALATSRGWKAPLRLMVDDAYPPVYRELPAADLRAEYWVDGTGGGDGDLASSGAFLRVATDQVRFYRLAAAENEAHAYHAGYRSTGRNTPANRPVRLDRVPPLVLSEILRDVDLFVGVASVGNDPTWSDGGPDGRFIEYWQRYSFGELTATAQTRKALLEALVPKLKIASVCSFLDRFLVVKGQLRTYKIHLGSGNILMEPNDQYLCIVPQQTAKIPGADLRLPFEGDTLLSMILSKALMLAADTKIKDGTITSQIQG